MLLKPCSSISASWRHHWTVRTATSLVVLATYLAVCASVLVSTEDGWSAIDSIYFCMMTMSTVGYGDFSPSTDGTRAFTLVMIFIGVGFIFPMVAGTTNMFFAPITAKGRVLLDHVFPPQYIDIDEDGGTDYMVPASAPVYFLKKLLPSALVVLVVQLASAAIFVGLEADNEEVAWTFGLALYHCFVTVTTVGYGDVYIGTQGGRLFSSVHMLVGVCLFAELLSTFDTVRTERVLAKQRVQAIRQELTPELMQRMTQQADALRPLDDDPGGLSELEFVLTSLLELGFVDRLTVEPFFKQFRALDVDPDGRISVKDVETVQALGKEELKELRRQNTAKFNEMVGRNRTKLASVNALASKVVHMTPSKVVPSKESRAA